MWTEVEFNAGEFVPSQRVLFRGKLVPSGSLWQLTRVSVVLSIMRVADLKDLCFVAEQVFLDI